VEVLRLTGGTVLVVGGGGGGQPGEDEEALFAKLLEDVERMGDLGRELEFPVAFHNHMWSITERPEQIERFLEATEIGWCPDLGHISGGGGDPQALLEKYGARVVHCHLKDVVKDEEGKWVRFCELGKGNAGLDNQRCLEILAAAGFSGWACVEQDQTTVTPYTDQKWNHDYLEGLGWGEELKGEGGGA
jgi:sugar phosphate isomerase/epimerase